MYNRINIHVTIRWETLAIQNIGEFGELLFIYLNFSHQISHQSVSKILLLDTNFPFHDANFKVVIQYVCLQINQLDKQ